MKALYIVFCTITLWQTSRAQNKVLEELHLLNTKFIEDFMHNDTAFYTQIVHPTQFVYIDANGQLNDRYNYLKFWGEGFDKRLCRDFRCADENIRVFGSTAIIIAKTEYMLFNGNDWTAAGMRYTDTFIKERGHWWCIQAQLTKIGF